nr:NlpC/P60 family protein [Anaerolineae bacterium]
QYEGYAYVYGGSSPATGFDCSGFAQYVCAQAGITLPRVAADQVYAGPSVSQSELMPGDLVFFQNTYGAGVSHVGIYVGGGLMIHASTPERGVCYDALDGAYWVQHWYGANRPWA